ncbi:hypothetical protein MUP77_11270 [Candidatus Bathyarchaeota archaeon]|nr:hypothetical protein [Candidatus Bathyarchaeota archaeon]
MTPPNEYERARYALSQESIFLIQKFLMLSDKPSSVLDGHAGGPLKKSIVPTLEARFL